MTQYYGFSIGISDMAISEDALNSVQDEIDDACDLAEKQDTERQQLAALSGAMRAASDAVDDSAFAKPFNALRVMIESGAKGSRLNAQQLIVAVGQQIIGSGRPVRDGNERTISCMRQNVDMRDPEGNGMIKESYSKGLPPKAHFFHATAGRKGLADTSCGTSVTGYAQRKMEKTMEDINVQYDGTVRNSQSQVISLINLDGMDPTYLERYVATNLLSESEDPKIEELRAPLERIRREQTVQPDVMLLVPFNIDRFLQRYEDGCGSRRRIDLAAEIWTGVEEVDEAIRRAVASSSTTLVQVADDLLHTVVQRFRNPSWGGSCLDLQEYHNVVVVRDREALLTLPILIELTLELLFKLERCAVEAGLAVGPRAAAGIAEPQTQDTLNSFHSTGAELKTGALFVFSSSFADSGYDRCSSSYLVSPCVLQVSCG